jgi:2,4-dichlorophenol 6-monooxygenase
MSSAEVDVLIVGGGACGLTASIILSDLGVKHLLVERRPSTTQIPKAHYYNQRMMEIMQQHGVARSIYAVAMPMANCKVRYVTSLGGQGPLDGRELFTFDAFGGGARRASSDAVSAVPTTHLSQIGLEPILKRHAEERSPKNVRFHHELLKLEQDGDGVTATIRDRNIDTEYSIRANYMIAADGGRDVGPQIGVVLQGEKNLARLVTAPFVADLSPYVPGDAIITHLIHPASRFKWGALVPLGPLWSKHSAHWAFTFAYHPNDPTRLSETEMAHEVRGSLGLPDLPISIQRVSEWTAQAVVADRFQVGRIFIAGDAAHRVIPTSGLGLNSAIQDAHNICWKLAAVLKGRAARSLLDTYETERRPASLRNAEWSLFTFRNHAIVQAGLGLLAGAPAEENVLAIAEYLSDTRLGRTLRARAREVIGTQRTEYGALDVELGGNYISEAVIDDGTAEPEIDPMGDLYTPAARPGHRLPHAWLARDAKLISTHDITGASASFALITGSEGSAWRNAAEEVAGSTGISIKVASVGIGAEYSDHTGAWDRAKGIDDDGAVLVRPDNIVGYRSRGSTSDPKAALQTALDAIRGLIIR